MVSTFRDFFMLRFVILFLFILLSGLSAQNIVPVRIQYQGGGDWYGNKTSWINILEHAREEMGIPTGKREAAYKITDSEFINHPIAYISGHGNIYFSDVEARKLRNYLIQGGFLFADDDYGMDRAFRREMKKIFPELKFIELSFDHPIYHSYFEFNSGLPKVHEHDGGPPKGLGLIYQERLVCFYSSNTDLSDGCEDTGIHDDSPQIRDQAMKMALNIFYYALTH